MRGPCVVARSAPSRPEESSKALHHRHDVALGVLEPRALRTAGGHDAVLGLHARGVVLLESHASRFQLGHLALDVTYLPECLAAFEVPAFAEGYMKQAVCSANW
jgi:hypothetical protein